MEPINYFIPNRDARNTYPLRDYVHGIPRNVAHKYIEHFTAPNDIVVDAFACTPTVAQVAQNLGRRVIAVESNPLWAWVTRTMAIAPTEQEINAALARLGDVLKDDAPLRAHISQLYMTICAACDKPTPADYFVHQRDGGITQRHYTCAHCGETRDDIVTEDDIERFKKFNPQGMHYHLAFERVIPADNLHADRIRKMLALYTPRNLYALFTLTQKIDALFREPRERNILLLLLLHALDRGTSFYPSPDSSAQLKTHKQFIEFNLWREIERFAVILSEAKNLASEDVISSAARNLPPSDDEISRRQKSPPRNDNTVLAESVADILGSPSAEMFVGRGNAKGLGQLVPPQSVSLVLTTLPSRRLSAWALSYLWCAWILGRDAAQPLVAFLDVKKNIEWERRWYFDTLVQSLHAFGKMLKADGRVVFVFDSSWHQIIEMLLLAAAGTGFTLETFLFQPRFDAVAHTEFDDIHGEYHITLTPTPTPALPRSAGEGVKPLKQIETEIQQAALEASSEILTRRGEPLAFSWVHHAAYVRAMREGLLAEIIKAKPKGSLGRIVHQAIKAGLSEGYAHDFDHYASSEQFVWLRRSRDLATPLIDRVEDAVHNLSFRGAAERRREISEPMQEISRSARNDIEDAIYRQFPGDLTPEAGLIELCVQAYAKPEGSRRPFGFEPTQAMEMLKQLGERLGYQWSEGKSKFDLVWESNGELAHAFVWRNRAQFADLAQIHIAPAQGYLVVPEGAIELLKLKAKRLPHLVESFTEAGWRFTRAPFIEKILSQETIERNDLIFITGLEPPSLEQGKQLELFDAGE
jgi:hypothetical protein